MAVLYSEIIRRKRDDNTLTPDEIADFVTGITDGSASDAHIAALAMAVFFNGLDREETVALTLAMRDSGDVLTWPQIEAPIVDKHSTGGVGDNVSLMLAPIVAACGLAVPMISGRGLGHTGGTLDKMDSIPGYVSQPDNETFARVVKKTGCAIIGQTANLAPADKRFYGVRDVTATVENLSLITASILSKKLAAGLGTLVLDVKFGNGAFMDGFDKAKALAESLVRVANGAGTKTSALLTDMNEPLASAAGNAVEVANAVRFLTGEARDPRLENVTLALCAEMVWQAGRAESLHAAEALCRQKLENGTAAGTFGAMVAELGGPADFVEKFDTYLPAAPQIVEVAAPRAGYVGTVQTRDVGVAVVAMGGGRRSREDAIDHAVGLTGLLPIGTRVERGDPLAVVHVRDVEMAEAAKSAILAAYDIVEDKPEIAPIIRERIAS